MFPGGGYARDHLLNLRPAAAAARSGPRAAAIPPAARPRRHRSDERGVILIWAAVTVMLIAGVVMSGAERIRALDRVTNADWTSGRTGARGCSRRPDRCLLVVPPSDLAAGCQLQSPACRCKVRPDYLLAARRRWLDDSRSTWTGSPIRTRRTIPIKGLVRAFEISPGLWARYEIATRARETEAVRGLERKRHLGSPARASR